MAQTEMIIGVDAGLKEVMQRVTTVAPSTAPVLLYGETGSGKEVIALAVHEASGRQARPFQRVNCGAIPPDLIDSELFGHEAGAFTGASSRRRGWFEKADGGTLFLDEVAELSPSAQVRLLRVLQEAEFSRVGGETVLRVDVRIIAATHRNLLEMVEKGTFRQDLYYRLAVFPVLIPPLRDRWMDFPRLTEWFAMRSATRFGIRPVAIREPDVALLRSYPWPGNIRELAAVIDRAVLLGNGTHLAFEAALGLNLDETRTEQRTAVNEDATADREAPETLDQVIRNHIEQVLRRCRGRIEGPFGAAERLGMNPSTLRSRMRKLGISKCSVRSLSS